MCHHSSTNLHTCKCTQGWKSGLPVVYSPECSPEEWWWRHYPEPREGDRVPRDGTQQELHSTFCYREQDIVQMWAPDLNLTNTHTGLAGPSQGRNRLSKLSWWRARLVTGPCQEWRETVRGVVSWGYGWRLTVHVLTVTLPDELTFCAVGAGGMWQVRLSN